MLLKLPTLHASAWRTAGPAHQHAPSCRQNHKCLLGSPVENLPRAANTCTSPCVLPVAGCRSTLIFTWQLGWAYFSHPAPVAGCSPESALRAGRVCCLTLWHRLQDACLCPKPGHKASPGSWAGSDPRRSATSCRVQVSSSATIASACSHSCSATQPTSCANRLHL